MEIWKFFEMAYLKFSNGIFAPFILVYLLKFNSFKWKEDKIQALIKGRTLFINKLFIHTYFMHT